MCRCTRLCPDDANADTDAAANAEKDAFFCFVHLMSDIRDHFCESLDHSESGIKGSLSQMMSILKAVDHQLWANLVMLCASCLCSA